MDKQNSSSRDIKKNLEDSFKEMQLMRQGILPKKSWKELKEKYHSWEE